MSVRLDFAGISAVLRSQPVQEAVTRTAEAIAEHVRAASKIQQHGATVVVESYETDRAAASVLVKHPAALRIEGKHGTITAAVAASGLQLHEPKSKGAL